MRLTRKEIARAREIVARPLGLGGGMRLRAAVAREAEYRAEREQGCSVVGCNVRDLGGPRDRGGMCSMCADEVGAMEREERREAGSDGE